MKDQIRFIKVEAGATDFFGLDDIGRVWRLNYHEFGKWRLTQFEDNEDFEWATTDDEEAPL